MILNLTAGQRINLAGEISGLGGGSSSWTITVANWVFQGSGTSPSASWDGTDYNTHKQVDPGRYTATIQSQASDPCTDSDTRTIAISVTATPQIPASGQGCGYESKASLGYETKTNLEIKNDSSINVASGNLYHSQSLFTLPRSKLIEEFSLSYNSLSNQNDVMGTGWTHTYNIKLFLNNDESYTLAEGDGKKVVLYSNGSHYTPQNSTYPSLTINQDGTYTLEHKEGIFYSFDQNRKITAIYDRNSNTTSFTYTGNNMTGATDPSGRNVSFTYDGSNRVSTITDPSGNTHTFTYTGQNLTGVSSQIINVGTASWSYAYYDYGFMHTKTDPLNKTTTYSYDSNQRLQQSTDPESKSRSLAYYPSESRTELTEKDSGVWVYKYNPQLGALTEVDYPSPYGTKVKYGYFSSGVNTGRLEYIEDQRGKKTWYAYDSNGNGNIASVTDALNNVTDYQDYNSLNQVRTIQYPLGLPEELRPVVNLDYDANGNMTYFRYPEANDFSFSYDSSGNLTGIQSASDSLVDMTYAYDQSNYLISITNNRTNAVVELEYDSAGNLSAYKDPMTPQNVTSFEYNGFNKVRKVTDPSGNITWFYYDVMGNLTSTTDGNQKATSYEYNYRGQIKSITDALSNITQFAYGSGCPTCGSGVERLTSVTDARGKVTIFEYDLAGRLIRETDPLGQYKTYSYNVSANQITKTDEDGAQIQYTYDDLNRLTQISYPGSTTATFSYDGRGNLITAANENISYTFGYNYNDLLSNLTDSNNKTFSYLYNGLNQRTQMVTPDARMINYGYDDGNRLGQITLSSSAFNLSYDLAGRMTSLSYPNGVTTSYVYNEASFLTSLVARNSQQTTINSFTYTPDGMGNRASMTDLAGQHSYTYDDTYQLTQATHPNMPTEQFGYDAVGNRAASGQPTPSLSTALYAYDFENRLTDVSYSDMAVHYKYDPFGRRIEKNVDGTITKYVYDGPNIVTQYDGDWNVQGKYLFTLDIDDPLMVQQGENIYYYHQDGLGSVVILTDSSQTTVQGYTYKSFGDIYSETGSVVQPFTFTGREYDPESGLYYYRARYYDPRAGRFLTKDPIGFAGGDANLYRYVQNNPINWIDPEGKNTLIGTIVGGAIAGPPGAVVGAIIGTMAGGYVGQWVWNTWFANEGRQNEATAVNGEGKSCPTTDLTPTGGTKVEPSTKKGNKGGKSVQVGYADPQGRPVTEHTVYDSNGNIIHGPHFRPGGFK